MEFNTEVLDKVADVVLVLAIMCGVCTMVLAAKLIALQRAGIRGRVEWTRWMYLSAALFIVWVILR